MKAAVTMHSWKVIAASDSDENMIIPSSPLSAADRPKLITALAPCPKPRL